MRKLALVLGVLAVLVAAPASALSLGGIKNQLIQWVLGKVSVEGVFEISVDEVVDAEDSGTTLQGVKIADADGTWFTADELTFDWNKSRLLRGQLVIDTLRLRNAEIMRQPVIPPGEEIKVDLEDADKPPEQFIWPRSPISTEIGNLVLQNIHLHEPVMGSEIRFDATGAARDIGDIQSASLDLQRTDDTEGRIDFKYTRDFAANTLTVDLDASEAAGGLVAAMLDLPDDVPTALTLNADGTPDAFNIAFNLDMPDYLQSDGTAVLDYAGPISVDADVKARPGAQMPEQIAQVLGEQAELVVKAAEGDDQVLAIETARLSSPYLRANASGEYSRATGAADLQVDLVAEPELAAPFEGVEFAGLSFNGNVRGQPGSLSADGDLKLEGFETAAAAVDRATLEIDVSQTGTAEQPTTELSVNGRVAGLRLDQIPSDVIGDAQIDVSASLTGSEVQLKTAQIDSQVLDVSASGTANIDTGDFDLSYQVAAPQIGPVLAPYGVDAKGTIDASGKAVSDGGVLRLQTGADLTELRYDLVDAGRLHLEGTVVQDQTRTTFDLSGSGERLRIDQLGPDLLQRADLSASGTLEDTTLTLEQAQLTSPVLDASAEGQVQTDGSDGQISYRIASEQIGPVAEAYGADAQGTVSATGTVQLSPDGPTLKTDANLDDFRSEFADAGRLHLEGTVAQQGERTTFDLTGAGERLRIDRIGPDLLDRADFAAQGALDGQQLTLDQARLTSPVLTASAKGSVDLETMAGRIQYDVNSVTLGPVADIYDVPVTGTASAEGVAELPAADAGTGPHVTGKASVDRPRLWRVPGGRPGAAARRDALRDAERHARPQAGPGAIRAGGRPDRLPARRPAADAGRAGRPRARRRRQGRPRREPRHDAGRRHARHRRGRSRPAAGQRRHGPRRRPAAAFRRGRAAGRHADPRRARAGRLGRRHRHCPDRRQGARRARHAQRRPEHCRRADRQRPPDARQRHGDGLGTALGHADQSALGGRSRRQAAGAVGRGARRPGRRDDARHRARARAFARRGSGCAPPAADRDLQRRGGSP